MHFIPHVNEFIATTWFFFFYNALLQTKTQSVVCKIKIVENYFVDLKISACENTRLFTHHTRTNTIENKTKKLPITRPHCFRL